MFMYLLKTAKDFIYIQKTINISTNYLKQKSGTDLNAKNANQTIKTQLIVDLNDQIARLQMKIVNEIVSFLKQTKLDSKRQIQKLETEKNRLLTH